MGGALPAESGVLMVARNEVSATAACLSPLTWVAQSNKVYFSLSFLSRSFLFLVCVSFPPDLVNDDVRRVLVGLQK